MNEPNQTVLTHGVVMRSTGSWYRIKTDDGKILECTLRGVFRLDGLKSTNPLAVGDRVAINAQENVIVEMLPRQNYILRKATQLSFQTQILCANVDQALFVATLGYPFTPLSYLDRFIVMCEAYHIPVVVIFNKLDLITTEKEREKLNDYLFIYADIGYQVMALSAQDPKYRDKLREVLKDKTTFVSGVSGAGKSSLITLADPALNLKTGSISHHSNKGRHTTTFAEMFDLSFGGAIIDAPGFREFNITGIEKEELSHYFVEMRRALPRCRFNNCTHTNEPDCGVKAALSDGDISETRYHTYLGMLEEIEKTKKKK